MNSLQRRLVRQLERFSIDCRKTKPLVITLPGHKEHGAETSENQSKLEANACSGHEARGKRVRANHAWFQVSSDWMRKWREFFKPVTQNRKVNPEQMQIAFDTQVKTALT